MPGETELERMVVRLLGDSGDYETMLLRAQNVTSQAAKEFEDATDDIDGMGVGLQSLGSTLTEVGSKMTLFVTGPLAAFAAFSTHAFGVQESAEIRLRGALEANGRQVGVLFREYAQYASQLQKVTRIGDEASLGFLQQAESLGLTGEQAKRAVRNAIGLAAAFDMSAKGAIRYTSMLEQGDTTMLNRYLPTLRTIKDQTERVAEAQRVLAKSFEVAKADAESAAGQLDQMRMAIGDAQEDIGEIIAEAILPFVQWIKELAEAFQELSPETKKFIVILGTIVAAIGPLLLTLGALATVGPAALAAILSMGTAMAPFALHVAAAAAVVIGLVKAVDSLVGASKELRIEMEKAERLDQRVREGQRKRHEAFLAEAEATTHLRQRHQMLSEQLEQAQRNMTGLANAVKRAEEEVKKTDTYANFAGSMVGMATSADAAATNLGIANQRLEDGRKRVEDLQEALKKLPKGFLWSEEERTAVMSWMNAAGEVITRMKEEGEAAQKLQEKVDSLTDRLRLQVHTQGMTSNEIEIYKLRMAGANREQLQAARSLATTLEEIEKNKKAMADRNQLMREGQLIMEQFATPMEKFKKRVEELNKLKAIGAIDKETMTRAIAEAQKQLDSAELKKDIKVRFTTVEGAEAGSAEAQARLEEFRALQVDGGRAPGARGDEAKSLWEKMVAHLAALVGFEEDKAAEEPGPELGPAGLTE